MWIRYKGWLDALQTIWKEEGVRGLFKGAVPRIMWFVPAAGLTFMSVELLRKNFNEVPSPGNALLPSPAALPTSSTTLPGRSPNPASPSQGRSSTASVDLASLTSPHAPLEEQVR